MPLTTIRQYSLSRFIAMVVLTLYAAQPVCAERVKDLTSVAGVRNNQLAGYGLVVGLNGTGDQTTQTPFTVQSIINMLTQFGVTIPAPFNPTTRAGIPLFEGSLNGEQGFDGAGSSSQSNSLVGDITLTVVERLPNGNLRIRGEKWVTLNQGEEFIQLSGIIRPTDIEPDNSLVSTRIADARITYSSKGVMAAANKMGWLSRFFHSMWHPY